MWAGGWVGGGRCNGSGGGQDACQGTHAHQLCPGPVLLAERPCCPGLQLYLPRWPRQGPGPPGLRGRASTHAVQAFRHLERAMLTPQWRQRQIRQWLQRQQNPWQGRQQRQRALERAPLPPAPAARTLADDEAAEDEEGASAGVEPHNPVEDRPEQQALADLRAGEGRAGGEGWLGEPRCPQGRAPAGPQPPSGPQACPHTCAVPHPPARLPGWRPTLSGMSQMKRAT